MSIPVRRFANPAPGLWAGWPRPYWDHFNAPGRNGYNPAYSGPGDPCGHKGVDLGADEGSDGQAAHDAAVHFIITPASNPLAGWGVELVEPAEGGWWGTRYLHAQEGTVCVRRGDTVKTGERIMRVGRTGNANYPHIHFEIRWLTSPPKAGSLVSQGVPLDPLSFGILNDAPLPIAWPALYPGDKHPCVPVLRGLLYGLGYGGRRLLRRQRFGGQLEELVRRFQQDTGISVDGVVGPETRRSLEQKISTIL